VNPLATGLAFCKSPENRSMIDKSAMAPRRVLIAEDISSMAYLMQTVLEKEGFEVRLTRDGEACLAEVSSFRPNLIILDLMLPKVHGMEVLQRLKSHPETRDIGVIVCTAKPYKADQDQALESGAHSILPKPFERERLLGVVKSYFDGETESARETATQSSGEVYLPTIANDRPYFKLWGTRGSIPVSNQRYVRHGGNTSCLEVGFGDELIIVDAGSGIRELGLKLAKGLPRKIHLLITHTHWDHIQGFPFFAPAYQPGFELAVYGAPTFKKDLKSVFRGQLDRDYFPVQFDDMCARIEFRPLAPKLQINGFQVTWEYTHHPAATVAYKFTRDGRSLAYVSDNEFLFGYQGAPHDVHLGDEILTPYQPLIDFLTGSDLLIAEAQYTNEEYRGKVGWGHSSLSNACSLAALTRSREWIVTHHDPLHDDDFLDDKLNLTKQVLQSLGRLIPVFNGYDGMHQYW
jgi:CheY-like chemotaxis protein